MYGNEKTKTPWEDIKEIHPWSLFPETKVCSKLIVGSFPPNRFTSHEEKRSQLDMDFFYGSKDSGFWGLFLETMGLNYELPLELANLKKWLIDNNWGLVDIVSECQRRKDTAYDSDLINIKWNKDSINEILRRNKIQHVYFTSAWVRDKYDRYIGDDQANEVTRSVLLSPSRNGLRRFPNYLEIPISPGEKPTDFRKRYYKHLLLK